MRPCDERYFRLTWRVTTVEWLIDPLEPVIVRVKLPTFVEEVVVTLRIDVPETRDVGLKDVLEAAGRPVTARLTLPVNPLSGVTVTV